VYTGYGELFFTHPYFFLADLLGDGTDEIVLVLPLFGSNYAATDVHVLKINGSELTEILTILDSPSELSRKISEYEQTLFIIPPPMDTDYHNWYDFCTGVSILTLDGKTALEIQHLQREVTPYSVVLWNGQEWIVAEQYELHNDNIE